MDPIVVTHALGSYPVYVEPGAMGLLADLTRQHLARRTVALVTDTTVGLLYEEWESGATGRWRENEVPAIEVEPYEWATRLSIQPGESAKSRENWTTLSDAMLEHGFGRDSGLVAVGGGVVGDLAGFVAATFMRGIPYLLVPTTTLSMLDSSVGGKTGVNTPRGKNLIGAFHPPAAVIADPITLRSLPDGEFRSGLAEAVKHGMLGDAGYFEWMEARTDAIRRRDIDALTELVRRSVQIKAEVVAADEREAGRRAILNAGHTIGHALEQASDYRLPHGEAVGLGLIAECALGERTGLTEPGLGQRVSELLRRLGLPVRLTTPLSTDRMLAAMSQDKKNRASIIRCALPSRLGAMCAAEGRWTVPTDAGALLEAIKTVS